MIPTSANYNCKSQLNKSIESFFASRHLTHIMLKLSSSKLRSQSVPESRRLFQPQPFGKKQTESICNRLTACFFKIISWNRQYVCQLNSAQYSKQDTKVKDDSDCQNTAVPCTASKDSIRLRQRQQYNVFDPQPEILII